MKSWKISQGMTLVELIVGISIIGIIAAFTAPNFHSEINKSEIKNKSNQVYEFVRLAKTESVKRNESVEVFFEVNGSDQYCLGMRKAGRNDACALSSSSYPRLVFEKSHHYLMKTVNNTGAIVDLPEGALFSFNPQTGKSSGDRRLLVASQDDTSVNAGVRVIGIGFVSSCSSYDGLPLCV